MAANLMLFLALPLVMGVLVQGRTPGCNRVALSWSGSARRQRLS